MSKREIRIFISSPSDVQAERDALKALVKDELQHTIGEKHQLHLVPVMWEELGRPGMGDIQDNLFRQLGEFNIFIGIFWHRFGTPSGDYQSGSEAEFRLAYEKWKADNSFPIFMYFCDGPLPNDVDIDQLMQVRSFRDEVKSKGLTWHYQGAEDLVKKVRKHLHDEINEFLSKVRRNEKPEEAPPPGNSPDVPAGDYDSIYGELLVYMLNRTTICEQIERAVLHQQEEPGKPVVCIIHGDSDQCIGEFVQRLQQVDLPNLWGLDKRTEKVHEVRFVWPGVPDTLRAFHGRLTRSISRVVRPTFRSATDVKAYIESQRTPVLISSHFLASDWERYGEGQILRTFLDYWRQLYPLKQRVVVLLSVKYNTPEYTSQKPNAIARSLFRWTQKPKSTYAHVEEALRRLTPPPCQSVILNVPRRLPNVTPADVEGWAWAYCKKEINRAQMNKLFLSQREIDHGVSMEAIVERLQPILPL